MLRRLLALSSSLLFAAGAGAECSCVWQGSFADVQANTDLVVSATVKSVKGNSIDVSMDRTLRGAETAETIRVWLKAKNYCRPEPAQFPVGSQWILALHQIKEEVPGGFNPGTPNISYGRIDDYRLSSCGGYWLAQTEDVVTGNLIEAPRWDHNPKMTPVQVNLLASFVRGQLDRKRLAEAARENPALRDLMLDTKAFLRE